jgi:hypothetical protein
MIMIIIKIQIKECKSIKKAQTKIIYNSNRTRRRRRRSSSNFIKKE